MEVYHKDGDKWGVEYLPYQNYLCPWCDCYGDLATLYYFDYNDVPQMVHVTDDYRKLPCLCAYNKYSCIRHKWAQLWCKSRAHVQLLWIFMALVIKRNNREDPWQITSFPIHMDLPMQLFEDIAACL